MFTKHTERARKVMEPANDQGLPEGPVAPAEVVEYVMKLLRDAMQTNASDMHFDQGESGWGQVRVRTDGVLHIVDPPPEGAFPKVVDYIKAIAAMNVTERRLPQDGICTFDMDGCNVRLFVSAVPAYYGERIVVRIWSQEKEDILLGLSKLGLSDEDLETVRNLSHLPSGIVIVNGPTGNGKTTLLYSMLMEINKPGKCILTVEDPVELPLAGIGQIQIRPQSGLTFPRAICHILHQDPDVIMVGEIRDLEVANLCNQCALTGHLVLTTLHANTSPGAVQRLLDMGLKPWLVSSSLAGVISMRLVRKLCPKCKEPANPPLHSLPPEAVQFIASHKDAQFFKPKGCEHCGGGHGYRGRTGIFEILVMNDRLRQLVTDGSPLQTLRAAAKEEGMKTLLMDGLEKAAQGITSIKEVLRVVPIGASI